MLEVSVNILTLNNEATLPKCLDSLANFSEVLVADGGSLDNTIDIANSYPNVRLINQNKSNLINNKIVDYSEARNDLIQQSKNDWILIIDSDEVLDTESFNQFFKEVPKVPAVYSFQKKYTLNGVIIDNASTYPIFNIRFFHKNTTNGFKNLIHETLTLKENFYNTSLMCVIYHSMPAINELWKKWDRYSSIVALDKHRIYKFLSLEFFVAIFFRYFREILYITFASLRNRISNKGNHLPLNYEGLRIAYIFSIIIKLLLHKMRLEIVLNKK